MRPLELTVQGFRSHRDATTFDFRGRRFIAITGPIGAGKSSLLEGISYALYGKTAREQRSKRRLICSRAEEARVRLVFSIEDREYEVVRALRRSGASEHVLKGDTEPVIGDAAVTARITELLGLDFAGFSSSVLLAQGKFAQFLEATPTARGAILKGIFRLDQIDAMRDTAKERTQTIDLELKRIEGERLSIPEDATQLLVDAREVLEDAKTRSAALEKALPREAKLDKELTELQLLVTNATAELSALTEASKDLPAAETLAELVQLGDEAESTLERARAEATATEKDLASAQIAVTELEAELGTEASLVEVRAVAEERGRLELQIAARIEELTTKAEDVKGLAATLEAARGAEERALAELAEARAQRAALEQAHKAHTLRKELAAGEPCPVCEQPVSKVPRGKAPSSLTMVERLESGAEKDLTTKRTAHSSARSELDRSEQDVANATKTLDEHKERLTVLSAELEPLGKDPSAEIEARLGRLGSARAKSVDAQRARDATRAAFEAERERSESFKGRCREIANKLARVSGRLDIEAVDIDSGPAELGEAARAASKLIIERVADAQTRIDSHRARAGDIATELEKLRAELGIDLDEAIADALSHARTEMNVTAKAITELEAKIARGEKLDAEEKNLRSRRRLFDQLAVDLRDRNFISFLLEDRTRLLFELASERLLEMTARYRLETAEDGELDVVDELDADRRRSIDTLSGGETFLASLSLAIALAELVSMEGGRLQCFFLDEGFGSLDAEAFDLAMDGIEKIVTSDRLIGVVSHIPALAARVEDRIELDRDPDGLTIVRTGASLQD